MTDDLLQRLDDAFPDAGLVLPYDHETARIRNLEAERDAAEQRETLAADAAVKYLERAEAAEAALATARLAALEEAAKVARSFSDMDHMSHDIRAGVFPSQTPPGVAIAAAIRAIAAGGA
jgi:hypothetical protein